MRFIALLVTSSVLITAKRPISDGIVTLIKSRTKTWTPYEADKNPFRNKSEAEFQNMFGLLPPQQGIFQWLYSHLSSSDNVAPKSDGPSPSFKHVYKQDIKDVALPDSFDARTEWPTCVHGTRS